MCGSDGGLDAYLMMRIGYRLLAVAFIIFVLVSMFYLDRILTFIYLGGLFSFILPILLSREELFEPWDFSYLGEED